MTILISNVLLTWAVFLFIISGAMFLVEDPHGMIPLAIATYAAIYGRNLAKETEQ